MKTFFVLGALAIVGLARLERAFAESSERQIAAGDILAIEVITGGKVDVLLKPTFTVGIGDDGLISLGTRYASVSVIGKTLRESEQAIAKAIHLVPQENVNVRVVYLGHDSVDHPRLLRETATPRATAPRVIAAGDVLQIESLVVGFNVRRSAVEADGNLPLGARWGRVNVMGKTLVESEVLIRDHMATSVQDPDVQVTFAIQSAEGPVDGADIIARLKQFERDISEFKSLIRDLKALKR